MNMQNVIKQAQKAGLSYRMAAMSNGEAGLFVSLEYTDETGRARIYPQNIEAALLKYLKRYKIPFEYRGNYTSLLIWDGLKNKI